MRCSEYLERSGQVEAKDLGVGSAFESVILFFFLHLFLFRSCFRVNARKNLTNTQLSGFCLTGCNSGALCLLVWRDYDVVVVYFSSNMTIRFPNQSRTRWSQSWGVLLGINSFFFLLHQPKHPNQGYLPPRQNPELQCTLAECQRRAIPS